MHSRDISTTGQQVPDTCHIGSGRIQIVLEREYQGRINIYAMFKQRGDRYITFIGGRNLEHQIRPPYLCMQALSLGDRPFSIICETRVDLKTDITVQTLCVSVYWPEEIGSGLNIFYCYFILYLKN
jgi:hypothetical protein